MNAVITLLWLELRKLGPWTLILWATVVLWAMGFRSIALNVTRTDEQAEAFFIVITLAAMLGLASGFGFVHGTWRDVQTGRFTVLLGAPLNPLVLLLSRYAYAFFGIALYALGVLWVWWLGLTQAGADASFAPLLGIWAYGLIAALAPVLASFFLLTALGAAYHLQGLSWLAGLVGMLGLGEIFLGDWIPRSTQLLPSIAVVWLAERPDSLTMGPVELPQELLWLGLALALLFLFLTVRILHEVEA